MKNETFLKKIETSGLEAKYDSKENKWKIGTLHIKGEWIVEDKGHVAHLTTKARNDKRKVPLLYAHSGTTAFINAMFKIPKK